MTSIDVEFLVGDDESEQVAKLLNKEGADQVETLQDEGFVPLVGVVIVAAIAATALANVVLLLSRLWKTGVIVDARGSTVRTQRDSDLPRGTVLVITSDGIRHELSQPTALDLSSLIEGAHP